MERPAVTGSQADCVLRLITQICKRTNLQMDIYQRAIIVAETEGRPDQVRDLRRFLGMQRQDRKLLDELIERLQGPRVAQRPRCSLSDRRRSLGAAAGRPSVRAEGSRGWRSRWQASGAVQRVRPGDRPALSGPEGAGGPVLR
ncbi:hypothetical protein AO501_33230 [Mycobacterium gordonae]|uniref:Uncharacterized protein n=1 Tax=Mycobacterium gordonae TaxID=1778 RepID=A0A0Q2UAR3_MYCGO|nr:MULTISPECIES: hypothetical protein [Mycobacterium]KQH77560.1 hypothetical protein AO501_33230 [Mycobacterium gordonae]MDP7728690.1 hypothetical protein [Mycobacterium sp. TY813]